MIKLNVQPFAGGFLRDLDLEIEDWVAKQPESIRRKIVTELICDYLNKHKYRGKSKWIPGHCYIQPDGTAHYTTSNDYPYVSIIRCKIMK